MVATPVLNNALTENGGLILIVEDEPDIAEILAAYLQRNGFRTETAIDGVAALTQHEAIRPDLVLLDVQLPREDGWSVLTRIRLYADTPVIMLTARDHDADKLMGLKLGADDYVVKPFNPAEVVARVEAVLRRYRHHRQPQQKNLLQVGPLQIDMENHEILVQTPQGKQPLFLTLTEFKLLAHMARAPKRVFTRDELMAACLPENDTLERTVDSHISKLRKKLESAGLNGLPICVRGVGYRLGNL